MPYQLLFFFVSINLTTTVFAQTEILIVGTLHDVEADQTDNYTHLLDLILPWNPQVIGTEFRLPTDTVSLQAIFGEQLYEKRDSLAETWNIAINNLNGQIAEWSERVAKDDQLLNRLELAKRYYLNFDRGNAYFQFYWVDQLLQQMSPQEQAQALKDHPILAKIQAYKARNQYDEYWQLAYPLAVQQGITYLYPTDDQTVRDYYHEAWGQANEELAGHPLQADWEQLLDTIRAVEAEHIAKGTAAWEFNSYRVQEMLYRLEGDFFPPGLSSSSDLRNYYWQVRNERMARHILEVADKHPGQRIVVFYGCSHVPSIRRILRSLSDHKILTLPDLVAR